MIENGIALILSLAIAIFALLGILAIVLVFRFIGRNKEGHDPARGTDEIRMMQETYKGLQRMEGRVEALETILMEGEKDAPGDE